MAAPQNLIKVAFGGTLFTDEIWAMGFHLALGSTPQIDPHTLQSALLGFLLDSRAGFTTAAKLTYIKANGINPLTGKYIAGDTREFVVSPAQQLGNAGEPAPAQMAVCVSLGTDLARGRSSKGRFFIPTVSRIIDASGRITTTSAQDTATSAAEMITKINALGSHKVVVWSKIGQQAEPVTHVRVGRVMDTQRRRRSSMSEDYQRGNVV